MTQLPSPRTLHSPVHFHVRLGTPELWATLDSNTVRFHCTFSSQRPTSPVCPLVALSTKQLALLHDALRLQYDMFLRNSKPVNADRCKQILVEVQKRLVDAKLQCAESIVDLSASSDDDTVAPATEPSDTVAVPAHEPPSPIATRIAAASAAVAPETIVKPRATTEAAAFTPPRPTTHTQAALAPGHKREMATRKRAGEPIRIEWQDREELDSACEMHGLIAQRGGGLHGYAHVYPDKRPRITVLVPKTPLSTKTTKLIFPQTDASRAIFCANYARHKGLSAVCSKFPRHGEGVQRCAECAQRRSDLKRDCLMAFRSTTEDEDDDKFERRAMI